MAAAALLTITIPAALPAQGTLPEWGRALTPAQGREMRAEIGRLSQRLGVRENTLVAIARVLGTNLRNIGFPELVDRVRSQAGRAAELQTQIGALRTQIAALTDAAVRNPAEQALARAAAAFEAGRLEEADRELARLEGLRRAESDAAQTAWAEAIEARARIAELRLDYDAAEGLRIAAARGERERANRSIRRIWSFMLEAAHGRYSQGELLGDNGAVQRAIALLADEVLPLAPREERPLDWATTMLNLGNALQLLGERERGTARLTQAARAYEAALEEATRGRAPLIWALLHNNLGNSLAELGEREGSAARLEQAVTAYRRALEEHRRERLPLDWAMTQSNLASALVILGGRENGTARLEQAVAAYRAALEEYTRERAPLDWAATQSNLGIALYMLGLRESGTARLEQAVAAYRSALQERSRERVPLAWAMTQNALAAVLVTLAERERGTARLEQAVGVIDLALGELTRDRVPLEWAIAQANRGNALSAWGERESGTTRLEQAIGAYEAAILEHGRERMPTEWAARTMEIAYVSARIGERTGDRERVNRAERQARDVRAMAVMRLDAGLRMRADEVVRTIAAIARRMDAGNGGGRR